MIFIGFLFVGIGKDLFKKRLEEIVEIFRCQTSGINELAQMRVVDQTGEILREVFE